MPITEGFIAVELPFLVSVCPHGSAWAVLVYGGPDAREEKGGIIEQYLATTVADAKRWAALAIGRWIGMEAAAELDWESLVCGGTGEGGPSKAEMRTARW